MKKIAILAALSVSMMSAMAVEVGVRGTHNAGPSGETVGVTVGQSLGSFTVEGAYDRSTVGKSNVNRWSALAAVPIGSILGATISAKGGVAFIDPSVGKNGNAFIVGVGAAYPIAKGVSLVADYSYQNGQDRVRTYNGNQVSVGAKYMF